MTLDYIDAEVTRSMKRNVTVTFFVVLALGVGWWWATWWDARTSDPPAPPLSIEETSKRQFAGRVFDPPRPAPDFTLTDQYGSAFRLGEHAGDVVVLFFGYTTCPDVCPTTLAQYRLIKEMLGDDADRVRFVFVTVDPERDKQERLNQYVSIFDPEFVGLTGDVDELQAVWRAYGIYVERVEAPDSPVGYWVNHSAGSYVIDPKGDLRLVHSYNTPREDVVKDLQTLLAEA